MKTNLVRSIFKGFNLRDIYLTVPAFLLAAGLLVPNPATAQTNFQTVRSFGFPELSTGNTPLGRLILGKDGVFYGTASSGGAYNFGVVFKINTNGTGYTVLHDFAGAPDGNSPQSELLQASDGLLYGTTAIGGSNDIGSMYVINTNGGGYQILHDCDVSGGDRPYTGMIEHSQDGYLYGVTSQGGSGGYYGALYRMSKDGTSYSVVLNFSPSLGSGPGATLLEGQDHFLYGTTQGGGGSFNGNIYKIDRLGNNYQNLHDFLSTGNSGRGAVGRLIQGSDGAIYGTCQYGGNPGGSFNLGAGLIFRIEPNGFNYQPIYMFASSGQDGYALYGGMCLGTDNFLYGVTKAGGSIGNGTIIKVSTNGASFTVLHALSTTDGGQSQGPLLLLANGTLYGTASANGAYNGGTIYKINTDGGSFAVLYSYFPSAGGDGSNPGSTLSISGSVVYGTTSTGGNAGNGIAYKVNLDGSGYAILHQFTNGATDGQTASPLIKGMDGLLYGAIPSGGTKGNGAIFSMDANGGNYTVLHNFDNPPDDGSYPYSGVIQGKDGFLYGVTVYGGSNYNGILFKLATNGTNYTILKHFGGPSSEGTLPYGALIQGTDNFLYGTTSGGGANSSGIVFKITTNGGSYSKIYTFLGNSIDGSGPRGSLLQSTDGLLYGTTVGGGAAYSGTIFRMNTSGTGKTNLYEFMGGDDGGNPYAGLISGANGILYGTTYSGGTTGGGVVYSINTNGSSFNILHTFAGSEVGSTYTGLALASDNSLYGTLPYGGSNSYGSIYKLYSAIHGVTITSIQRTAGNATINFIGGTPGQNYDIYATTNLLNNWQVIGSSLANSNGAFIYIDSTVNTHPNQFYRSYGP